MKNYPMGKYYFPKTKRHNRTYRGKLTKYQQKKQNKDILIAMVFVIFFTLTTAFLQTTNEIKINGIVDATEVPAVFVNGGGGGVEVVKSNNIDTSAPELPYETLPFEEKMTPIQNYIWGEFEKAGLDPNKAFELIDCESSWKPEAYYINQKHNSIDRGLFMINSYYHPEVSPTCAYDYKCVTQHAVKIVRENGWGEWTCGNKLNL